MHYVSAQRGVVYRCGRFVLIAVGYLLFAQLGLLLATDHTQVSVVWPAAGLALAAVLLVGRSAVPAVVLGSLLANSLGPWGSAQDVLSASLTFLPVAVGAGLQAWLGAVLVRRGVAFPNPLYRTRDIWLFSLLSGPLACISNALISSLSFLLQGMIEPAEFFHHALIWWASDTMGVLIFAPACLLLVDSGTYLRRQRRWTVIVPVLLILSLLTSLTVRQQRLDANESVSALAQELETVRAFVDRDITVAYSLLDALKAFYRVAGNVTQSEFQSYTEHILSRHAWLFGMRWIERVTADARADWEASTGSVISTYDPHQQRRVAVPADVPQLYPVRFWVDSSGDRDLLGYTLGARAASLAERAGDDIVVLPSFRLQALPDTPLATIFASAVYAADSGELQGFVAVLLQFDQLLNNALQVGGQENLIVTLEDVTDPESPQPLFSSLPAQSGSGPGRAAAVPVEANTRYALLRAGGREWRLGVSPTPAYLDQLQGDSNALALVGALAFIWLLMLILLIVTGQEALVRGEVVEKTRQLRMALAAMQSASEAKSRFLASVSHELRTPLNSIIGFSRRLLERGGGLPDPRQREAATIIHRNGRHLLSLINDILDISKIEAGEVSLEPVIVDVTGAVHEVRQTVLPMLEAKPDIRFHVALAPGVDSLVADRRRLLQILFNLVSNAIKFTSKGTVSLRVEPRRHGGREGLRFMVTDTGVGIAATDIDSLFSPFFQLEAGRSKPEGTGLGLVLVKELAELHGGHVGVSSEPGLGSEFWVWLPLAADAPRGGADSEADSNVAAS